MNRRLFTATAAALVCSGAFAQFYGEPLFTENFDTQESLDRWTINTTVAPDGENSYGFTRVESGFDDIDPSSTHSLEFNLEDDDVQYFTTVTSPVIDATGASKLVAGFYAFGIDNLMTWHNIYVYFEVKAEGDTEWTSIYTSPDSNYIKTEGWNIYEVRRELPAEFDGKKLQIRFRVECEGYNGWGNTFYIDDVYVSQKNAVDAVLTNVEPNTNGAFTEAMPILVQVANNGRNDLTSFVINYSINDGETVSETINRTILPGETIPVMLSSKGDFTEIGTAYSLKAEVVAEGDGDLANNEMTVQFNNIITTVPYVPVFVSYKDMDFWENPEDPVSGRSWSSDNDKYHPSGNRVRCWKVSSHKEMDINCNLFSRPMQLSADDTYCLAFSLLGDSYAPETPAAVEVYIASLADRDDESKWTKIYSNDNVVFERVSEKVNYNVPSDGIYYIVFKGVTKADPERPDLFLIDISVSEALANDINVIGLKSPVSGKAEYSAKETVTVALANSGTRKAEGASAALYAEGKLVATELLPAIEPGEQIDYTFEAKADLSQGRDHTVRVAIVWDADQDPANNETSATFTSSVFTPPYYVDTYNNDFAEFWRWTDNNNDGKTFELVSLYGNDQMTFNNDNSELESVDETLYSRALKLLAGKAYRISPRISMKEAQEGEDPISYHVATGLYKVADDNYELVKIINEQDCEGWNTYNFNVDIDADGIYVIGFHVTKETPIASYLRLNEFGVYESGPVDLSINSVSVAARTLSAYRNIPVSVSLFNNGSEPVSEFDIVISSSTMESKSFRISPEEPIPAYENYVARIPAVDFNITGNDDVKFELVAEGDAVESNNTKFISFSTVPSLDVPAEIPGNEQSGWYCFNHNNDYSAPEYYSWYGGFNFTITDNPNGDELTSRSLNLKKDTPYEVTLQVRADGMPHAGKLFEIKAVNAVTGEAGEVVPMIAEKDASVYGFTDFTSYLNVPADGEYYISVKAMPFSDITYYATVLTGAMTVNAMEQAPDVRVDAVTAPEPDRDFTDNETVTAKFTNAGTADVKNVQLSLAVGDALYYAAYAEALAAGEEGTVEFTGVDLYTPGEYDLTVTAIVPADATPADNVLTAKAVSPATVDLAVVSIDGPRSGDLGKEEHVTVTIANNGHGALTEIPLTLSVTSEKDEAPVVVRETVAGPLAEGESMQYEFTTPSNFSKETTYTLTVESPIENDVNTDDNSATTKVSCTHEDMDAGVTSIVAPYGHLFSGEEYLVIEVSNFGLGDLYDVPVKAQVLRGEEVVASLEGIVPEIPAEGSVEYTFPTPMTMTIGGEYAVEATTALPTDADTTNDALTGAIYGNMIDCGVSSVISPEKNCVAGQQPITVEITNFGDEPVSNIPVYFKLGNNPQKGTFEGEILPGEKAEYTFASKYNFRADREYTLTAYTGLESDMNPDNDACELNISPMTGVDGIYAGDARIWSERGRIVIVAEAEGQAVVYDAAGAVVAEVALSADRTEINVPAGIYMVLVRDFNTENTVKVIVR